jgi:hypothetical protein
LRSAWEKRAEVADRVLLGYFFVILLILCFFDGWALAGVMTHGTIGYWSLFVFVSVVVVGMIFVIDSIWRDFK